MKTAAILLVIIVLPLIFFGCDSSDPGITSFNPYQGSEGIGVEFLKNAPPKQVYQGEQVSIIANMHNKGAYHVISNSSQDDKIFFHITFDKYYFQPITPEKGQIQLTGKNYYDHLGESKPVEFVLQANALEGQRESPESQIIFNLCYPYHTKLVQDICLDSDPFNLDKRKKTCNSQTISFKDQGAPIAITIVEPRMSVMTDDSNNTYVSPSFIITFKNVGSGNLVSRTEKPIEDQCNIKNTGVVEFGHAKVQAKLSSHPLVCSPQNLSFIDNEAKTTCFIQGESKQFIPLTFVTQPDVLYIDLDYIYLDAITKTVEIVR